MGRFRGAVPGRLRNILGLRVLVDLGVDHGLPVRTCLAGTGVLEANLSDLAARATADQEMQVIRNLQAHLGSVPALGALAGTRYHATAWGPLGIALISSPTTQSALTIALRFLNLTFALTRFEVSEAGGQTIVSIDGAHLPAELQRFVVERDAAVLVTVQRDLLAAHSALASIDFALPAPPQIEPYQAIYGVRPTFGAKANTARLNNDVLMLPLPQANELALRNAVKQCETMLEQQESQVGLSAQIRELLTHNLAAWADMQTVAGYFCVTPRTLRRRLLEEGTTFIDLRDQARITMAEELLTGRSFTVDEISSRLGYSSSTTFINAFKRWKGVTPLVYRSANTARPVGATAART